MELYHSTDDPAEAIIAALHLLDLPFTAFQVDIDTKARERLIRLSNQAEVPTLVLDNGSVLVNPTPEAFVALMHNEAPPRFTYWRWLSIGVVVLLSLLSFALVYSASQLSTGPLILPLAWMGLAAVLGLGLLSLLPPVRKLLRALGKLSIVRWFKALILPLYAVLLALVLSAQHKPYDIWLWGGTAAFLCLLSLCGAAMTRNLWASWQRRLQKVQSLLGLLSLLILIPTLCTVWLLPQGGLMRYGLFIQAVLLGGLALLGAAHVVGPKPGAQAAHKVVSLLMPIMGLLTLMGLL